MIKFTKSIEIYKGIEVIVSEAEKSLFLISPLPKFSSTILGQLRKAGDRNVKTIIAYNKNALNETEKSNLSEIQNLTAFSVKHLHAKWYFNEESMIVTSMNLQESFLENMEEGFYISKNESYFQKIIEQASSILEENYGSILPSTKFLDDKSFFDKLEHLLVGHNEAFSDALGKITGEIKLYLDRKFDKIERKLQNIDDKVDMLSQLLKSSFDEIASIKKSQREGEEKLSRIYFRLSNMSASINGQKQLIEEYTKVIQNWLDHWSILNDTSKNFLISAEFIYDAILDIEPSDYSPFVIQYCRALENEILTKLFNAYHDDFHNRIDNCSEYLKKDLLENKTSVFAKFLKQDKRAYTLGQMSWIMMLSRPESKTFQRSDLLKDFRKFAINYFEEDMLDKDYQKNIKTIQEDFRNKAAHPYLMDSVLARQCQELVKRYSKKIIAEI